MAKLAPTKWLESRRQNVVPLALTLVLAAAGVGVSIELSLVHYKTHMDPNYRSICAVNEQVNCETVARSPYSVFLGAPVSAWGIYGYAFMGLFAAWGISGRRLHGLWPFGVLSGLTLAAAAASSILAYISFTRIDSICLFCTTLYVINLILLAIMTAWAILGRVNPVLAILSDLRAVLSKPLLFVGLIAATGGCGAAVATTITPYWQHAGWLELKELPQGVDKNGHHWIGAEAPLVTIVEFSDYECPFCRHAHKNMRLKTEKYSNDVRLVHRHLPLDNACNSDVKSVFHKRACEFAKAAECAHDQDAFWKMNDALFSIQDSVRPGDVDLEAMAVSLGLDRSRFKQCMASPDIPKRVLDDMRASRKLDIRGTPTFFLGPQEFEGGIDDVVIESALKRARERKRR